jgi:hypothetical protein
MVCFIRATELNVGKQYIYYDYMTVDILGTYLENGDFEYQNPTSMFDIYELSPTEHEVSSNSIPYVEIEAYIKHINSSLELYTGSYFKANLALPFGNLPRVNKPPVDPKLLRLREMLKKI